MSARTGSANRNLLQRVVTGVLGGAAIIALVLHGGVIGARALAALLALCMNWEYGSMAYKLSDRRIKRGLLIMLTLAVSVAQFFDRLPVYDTAVVAFLILFAWYLFAAGRQAEGHHLPVHLQELGYSFFGLFYLGFLPLYLVWLMELDNGPKWILLFFLIVWMGDTGGYFGGRFLGKRKLYPAISPKKTWEGYATGLLFSLGVAAAFKHIYFVEPAWSTVLTIAFVVNACAQVGDLCESLVKRAFDKKDSGSIIPGHGGFLDRFDAVVFTLPIMYICVTVLS
ncbi:MAG TPA: phosphatidate cytidylyltransferase [Bdellovibrionota bacterium]|jgi:phosphatidate cytidylyltransferase|nr:phosphatidate cytidylyltransferase [Bdellovibrionota bacterium]